MVLGKKLNEILNQVTVLDDAARFYLVQSSQDSYILGSTIKALFAGGVATLGTYASLPASPSDGKMYWVNDASGDPELANATGALYFYQLSTTSYIRVVSVEELAGNAGDMLQANYDSNADNKVNEADSADELAGSPTANQYWGTDGAGNQNWFDNSNLAGAGSYLGDYEVRAGTSHQVQTAHNGVFNSFTSGSLATLVVPTNAADPLPIDSEYVYFTEGAGGVQLDITGITIVGKNSGGVYHQLVQGDMFRLKKVATNKWLVFGATFGLTP